MFYFVGLQTESTTNGDNDIIFRHNIRLQTPTCNCEESESFKSLLYRVNGLEEEVNYLKTQCTQGCCGGGSAIGKRTAIFLLLFHCGYYTEGGSSVTSSGSGYTWLNSISNNTYVCFSCSTKKNWPWLEESPSFTSVALYTTQKMCCESHSLSILSFVISLLG